MPRFLRVMWRFWGKKKSKEVQTTIRVHPHVLESNKLKAVVLSESKPQTEVSLRPDEDDKMVYSPLEYTPFQDIQYGSIRVINLPRKVRLHFSTSFMDFLPSCLWDDDGVNELCIDLKTRAKSRVSHGNVTYADKFTQTTKR